MRFLATLSLLCLAISVHAQKKVMEHKDKVLWNSITNVHISNSGDYTLYALEKGEKDKTIQLKTSNAKTIMTHERSKGGCIFF